MKKMFFTQTEDEKGSVLLIVVLVLIALTLIGIFAINTTNIEINIAGNDRSHKTVFYNADSGVYTIPKVISEAINNKATPNLGGITYLDAGMDDFYRELAGLDVYDTTPDISYILGDDPVQVDVQRGATVHIVGGGAEFGSAVEGASASLTGIYYNLDSFGTGAKSSQSNVGAEYLKIIGIAGGM